jgi:hypothetical protein
MTTATKKARRVNAGPATSTWIGGEGMNDSTGLVHVPTVPELAKRGLARSITASVRQPDGSVRDDTRWQVSAEGQRLICAAQETNATVLKANPEMVDSAERSAIAERH